MCVCTYTYIYCQFIACFFTFYKVLLTNKFLVLVWLNESVFYFLLNMFCIVNPSLFQSQKKYISYFILFYCCTTDSTMCINVFSDFFYCGKIFITKFTILTILNVQFSSIKYIHNATHHHYPFSKLFIIPNRNSVPINQYIPTLPHSPW